MAGALEGPSCLDRASQGNNSDVSAAAGDDDLATSGTLTYHETGRAIAVAGDGSVVVCGQTGSSNFPTTTGAAQSSHGGGTDGFVTKLKSDGSGLVWCTYNGIAESRGC